MIPYRATPTSGSNHGTTTTVVSLPTAGGTVVAGDPLIIFVAGGGTVSSGPSGFTLQQSSAAAGGLLYTKTAGASEPSTYTITWTANAIAVAVCVALNGSLVAATWEDPSSFSAIYDPGATGSCAVPGVTLGGGGETLLGFFAFGQNTAPGTITLPGSFTQQLAQFSSGAAASDMAMIVGDNETIASGATGTITATSSTVNYPVGWITGIVPAGAAATAPSMPLPMLAPGWQPGGLPGLPGGTPFYAPWTGGLPPAAVPVTGTGSLALPKPSLAGTGTGAAAGTGSLALPTPSLSGAGAQEVTGTGSLRLPKPSLAGTGAVAATGTGGLALVKPKLAGTGTGSVVTGTGSLALPKPSLSGSGSVAAVFGALPATPSYPLPLLDTRVELNLGGTWTDISSYVYERDQVTITRGHPDESTTTAPSSAKLTISNRDGRFSDLNPVGPWYGLIGQNTPLRISVPEGKSYLRSETDQVSYAQCPDSAGVSITGDTEIQVDATLDNWFAGTMLASKWAQTGNERSWALMVEPSGTVLFVWSPDGSAIQVAPSAVPLPVAASFPLRRLCLRVTLAVSTGTVTFYTSPPGLSAPAWTQLGAAAAAGAHSVFDSTAPLQVGYDTDSEYVSAFGWNGFQGKIHAFKLLSGIGGTVKASPDFTAQTPGATSFSDAQSNTWSLNGTAEISSRKYRIHAEVSAWPQAWDSTGTDVWAQITASGVLRRLGQNAGGQVFQSAMYRAYARLTGSTAPVAYWPGEDGSASTQIASGMGGPPMLVIGAASYASFSGFACTNPIPTLNGATLSAVIPAYSGGTDNVLRFLMAVPSGGDGNGAVIARMYTTGTVRRVDVSYGTGGTLRLSGIDGNGATLFDTGSVGYAVNGELLRVSLELRQVGGNVQYSVVTLQPGASSALGGSATIAGTTGPCTLAEFNTNVLLTSTAIGQISYQSVWDSLFDLNSDQVTPGVWTGALNAWVHETAGNRFARLCAEEGISFRGVGNLSDTTAMGAQSPEALTSLLQECADADRGIAFEPRQAGPGLGYRTRKSLLNQSPAVTLSYAAAHLSDDLAPTRDDQQLANDVTATQGAGASSSAGSSAEQVLATGPLSIQQPPNGAGRYPAQVTVNVASAGQLNDVAGWMVHMGTVAEPRYPLVNVNLARSAVAARYWDLQDLDLGDYLQVTGQPLWLPPSGINQLVQGVTEVLYGYVFHEAWACIPGSPWNVAVADDATYGRADTDGSTVHANIASGATSMQVDTTTAGSPLWTASSADRPFDILVSGERMTVTNVTGSSSPQTFTVTRSVNSVVKAQTAGTPIVLFSVPTISL